MTMNDDEAMAHIRDHLLKSRGIDISGYSPTFMMRSLRKRMGRSSMPDVESYVDLLIHDDAETTELISALSINVTEFFRDDGAFEALSEKIIRPLLRSKRETGGILRIWSAGCATGQETYTIAICLNEEMRRANMPEDMVASITGTDISASALAFARKGDYSESLVKNVPTYLLKRYFIKNESSYEIKDLLRKRVRFMKEDLMETPKSKFFDAIICRNVLIYFSRPSHDEVIENLHESLRSGGFLMLGRTEALMGRVRANFEMIDPENRIFVKVS
ncbi:MAG: protein-glutamate O-methyltransferase CheR [Thermoplasmata archaeon]|nr:protein-glutamate O-methyltransferase CheR [Thermoplasmata archaeon]